MGNKHPTIIRHNDILTKEQILNNKDTYLKNLQKDKLYTSSRRKMVMEYFNSKNKIHKFFNIKKSNFSENLNINNILNLVTCITLQIKSDKEKHNFNIDIYNSSNLLTTNSLIDKVFIYNEESVNESTTSNLTRVTRNKFGTVDEKNISHTTLERNKSFLTTNTTIMKRSKLIDKQEIRSVDLSRMINLRPQKYIPRKDISFLSDT